MKAQLGGAQLGVDEFVPHLPPPCGQIRVLLRWRRVAILDGWTLASIDEIVKEFVEIAFDSGGST
jgi:hypothetical protein